MASLGLNWLWISYGTIQILTKTYIVSFPVEQGADQGSEVEERLLE